MQVQLHSGEVTSPFDKNPGSAKGRKKNQNLAVTKRLNLGAKGSLSPNASRRIGAVNRNTLVRTGSPLIVSNKNTSLI